MNSHGFAELAPTVLDEAARTLELTLRTRRGTPRRVRVQEGRSKGAVIEILGPAAGVARAAGHRRGRAPGASARSRPVGLLREGRARPRPRVGRDGCRPDAAGTDRLRGRREDGLHDELRVERDGADGERAGRAPRGSGDRRHRSRSTNAFPTPATMADTPEAFYRDVVRAGLPRCLPALARAIGRRRRARPGGARVGHPRRAPRRGARATAPRAPGRGAVRGRAHHDDDRPELPVDPRFVDPAEVRASDRAGRP